MFTQSTCHSRVNAEDNMADQQYQTSSFVTFPYPYLLYIYIGPKDTKLKFLAKKRRCGLERWLSGKGACL